MLPHQNAIDENVQGRKGGDHGWSCAAAQECTAAGDPRDPQNASVLGCDPALREQTASGGQVKAAAPPFEFQMLYGIQRGEQLRLAREGWRARVLIAYGDYWYPWFMRRLAERPANLTLAVRNLFGN